MSKTESETERLKAEVERLKLALNVASRTRHTLKFRIESTKTANSFHVSFNELFNADDVKTEYSNLFITHEQDTNTYVFKTDLRQKLKQKIIDALN